MTKATPVRRSKKELEEKASRPAQGQFVPVIGIGSSAGGLEALELFLKNVPPYCGMAIVIVQHMDPTHKGIMVELLQRITTMPVSQVIDRQKVEADHVYLIPPNQDMTILHGVLHLLDMVKPRGLRLPIDFFFRSMADDLQQDSIGVILSGMGSDGTLGLRAIKEKGGGVFVQDPASAKFDGMPRSAIDEGLADVVAPVEELPAKIFAYLKHFPVSSKRPKTLEERALTGLEKVVILLRAQTGHDFSLYKKNTIYRRIERRMGIHQIDKITDYVRYLQGNPQEIELLFKELLIGVTGFFRDPDAWDALKTQIIPQILAARSGGGVLRAWVVGCSTGEEAYSLAMVFRDVIASLKPAGNFKLQIFATDLDKDAIEKARLGTYPLNITADVSPERLKKYFEKDDRSYRISREIRETIVFAPHNVIMDPPFTKLDILVCRNLLIYMEQELQKKLFPLFHYSLNSGGALFLGSAETVGPNGHLFETIDNKQRLFRKIYQGIRQEPIDFPAAFIHPLKAGLTEGSDRPVKMTISEQNLQGIIDQILLKRFAPAAVVTNEKGDIIYISGRTGKYLEPAAGKASLNIFAMAREGLRYDLNILFNSAIRQKTEMTKTGLTIGTNGGTQLVDVTVNLFDEPDFMKGLVMIVFSDLAKKSSAPPHAQATPAGKDDSRLASLQDELKQAKDELLTIREEMQTSQEELKSTNEEMQSANEELQSTNEELTTSKEEMQSLNEELQTVNQELQSKVSDLSQVNNDMKNLLNSTDIATLFLDDELNVRRFTTRTATLIKLIASDIGRPITDIVTDLNYPALADDAREVLHSLVYSEKQAATSDGRWYNVKIMPYRTQENRIDGVVITFTDVSIAKKYEQSLRGSEENFRCLFEAMPVGVMLHDAEGKTVMVNREAERITKMSMEELQGKALAELRWKLVRGDGSDFPVEEHPLLLALRTNQPVSGVVMGVEQPAGQQRQWFKVAAMPQKDEEGKLKQVYTTYIEIIEPG
ncbi:MAG: PAS domain S-box protein [Chlorobiaceae bacterium]|nr:PAS domain S-box protein [Chlorobiaceae bacterium]